MSQMPIPPDMPIQPGIYEVSMPIAKAGTATGGAVSLFGYAISSAEIGLYGTIAAIVFGVAGLMLQHLRNTHERKILDRRDMREQIEHELRLQELKDAQRDNVDRA